MKRSVVIKRLGYEASAALDNLRYIARRLFIVSGRRVATCKTPQKKVGQTGSLPGFHERSHLKSQGKPPGSAAHPCLLASVSRSLPETQQARMPALPGGLPYPYYLVIFSASAVSAGTISNRSPTTP